MIGDINVYYKHQRLRRSQRGRKVISQLVEPPHGHPRQPWVGFWTHAGDSRGFSQQSRPQYCADEPLQKFPPPPVFSPPALSDIQPRRVRADHLPTERDEGSLHHKDGSVSRLVRSVQELA